jgi:hypothetical protein
MRKLSMLAAATLALGACKKEQPAPPASAAAPANAPAPVAAAPVPAAAPKEAAPVEKPVLTEAKLKGFVKYQQKMLEVHAQVLKDVKAMDAKGDAGEYGGAVGGFAAANDAVGFIKRKDEAMAAARADSGLTEAEVEQFEAVVGDVVMKRTVGKTMNLDSTLKQMEQMRASLPKEQQAGVDQALVELKKQMDEMKSLSEEREKYGSANVDLVLSQEAELTANQEKLLGLWSQKP